MLLYLQNPHATKTAWRASGSSHKNVENRCLLLIVGLFLCKRRKSYQYLFCLVLHCNHQALLNMDCNYSTVSTMTFQYKEILWISFVDTALFCPAIQKIIEALNKKAKQFYEDQLRFMKNSSIYSPKHRTTGSRASCLAKRPFTWRIVSVLFDVTRSKLSGLHHLSCFWLWVYSI